MSPRLMHWLAMTVCIGLLFLLQGAEQAKRPSGYSDDLPYLNAAVARSMAATGVYGINGEPRPAVQEVWWRWMGGKLSILSGRDPADLFRIMAVLFSASVVLLLIKTTSLQYAQYPVASWATGLLMVCSAPMGAWTLNGLSTAFAALLILLAVVIHMSACAEYRPLPLTASVCIGFACCLHVEFLSVWLALLLHGIIAALTVGRKQVRVAAVFLRGLSGLVVCSLFLAPLVHWNLRVIQVPWPRSYDSAMALDALSGAASPVSAITGSFSGAYSLWASTPFLAAPAMLLFALGGLAYWIIRSRGGSRDNYCSLAMVLGLVPLFHAFFIPFVGWSGGTALYQALTPLWVLAVIAGVAAIQHGLDPLLARILPAFSTRTRHIIAFSLFAVTPILGGAVNQSALLRADAETVAAMEERMTQALAAAEGSGATAYLTDQPGRLIGRVDAPVFDLKAELNPELLGLYGAVPAEQMGDVLSYIHDSGFAPVAMIAWNRAFWIPADAPPCREIGDGEGEGPFVCVD